MIGNGDPAVKSYSDPAIAGCGLPSEGFVRTSTTYNLIRDCQQTGSLYIPRGVTVTINGNHHTITAASDHIPIYTAGTLTARDFVLTGSTRYIIRALLRSDLLIENAIFRGNSRPILLADHTATFRKVLFENNSEAGSGGTDASALRILRRSTVILEDSIFRGNSGGAAVIYAGEANPYDRNAIVTLQGCNTFEDNTPENIANPNLTVTDNNTGPCPAFMFSRFSMFSPPPPKIDEDGPRTSDPRTTTASYGSSGDFQAPDSCHSVNNIEAIAMGVVACVFRRTRGGETILQVYGIDENSNGFHLLTVRQSQLDAAFGESIIGVSPDGRALVVMWADRNVTIKVGPDAERKILHLTLRGGLYGQITEFFTTYGDAPGLPYLGTHGQSRAPASTPDNNGVTALQDCIVTTFGILNFRQSPPARSIPWFPMTPR